MTPETFDLIVIGDRINPGFKSVRALVDTNNLAGLQAEAVKQVEAGAKYLDVTIGPRAVSDPGFMMDTIRAIQDVTSVPLCFDFPTAAVQEVCLKTYDRARANGALPLINSITEHRWDIMDLYKPYGPFKVIVMASERVEDGVPKGNKTAAEIIMTAKRAALRLVADHGMAMDDIFIDISISAVIADTTGLHRATLEAIRTIRADPELKGIHIMGGLTNISQQMPPKAADGSDLKLALECAFLTLAVPLGFDAVLATPWRALRPLPDDNHVLTVYKNFLEQSGSNALRAIRKFYKA